MTDYKLIELPYNKEDLAPGISEQVVEWHHGTHHQGYVDGLNKAEQKLQEQREEEDFSATGSLLNSFTHNFCGNVLHDIFWENMSPEGGGKPEGELMDKIEEEFGSYENWKKEFKAAAGSASGWALLVYIPQRDELHNVAVDRHDEGAVWGAHPILACDVWEHSYYHDYGPKRGDFVDSFFQLIDWTTVQDNFMEISKTFN